MNTWMDGMNAWLIRCSRATVLLGTARNATVVFQHFSIIKTIGAEGSTRSTALGGVTADQVDNTLQQEQAKDAL